MTTILILTTILSLACGIFIGAWWCGGRNEEGYMKPAKKTESKSKYTFDETTIYNN